MIFVVYIIIQLVSRAGAQPDVCTSIPQLMTCPSIAVPGTHDVIKLVHKRLSSDHPIARDRLGYTRKETDVLCKLPACIENPCLHGGTCVETIDGYECTCPANWTTGVNCEGETNASTTVNYACLWNPCLHGGICVETNGGYECTCPTWTNGTNCEECYTDCNDILKKAGHEENGVYQICLLANGSTYGPVNVWCEMGTRKIFGWTVLQWRDDGSVSFDRPWQDYKNGFGNLSTESWLGNDLIHLLTHQKDYVARVSMVIGDDNEYIFAEYKRFRVANESLEYQLTIGRNTGKAGDAMSTLDGRRFSTADRDNDLNDTSNCAQLYGGGWFTDCDNARINARGSGNGTLGEWIVEGASTFFKSINIRLRPK